MRLQFMHPVFLNNLTSRAFKVPNLKTPFYLLCFENSNFKDTRKFLGCND